MPSLHTASTAGAHPHFHVKPPHQGHSHNVFLILGLGVPPNHLALRNAGSRAATAQRSAHPPSAVSDAWPADRIGLPICVPLFWDSVSDCRGRTELCCASFCALPLLAVSAVVRSLAPDARSPPTTGPGVAARMPLPALTVRRDRPDHPHSSSLECHGLTSLSSPFARTPLFTVVPNGKHWPALHARPLGKKQGPRRFAGGSSGENTLPGALASLGRSSSSRWDFLRPWH